MNTIICSTLIIFIICARWTTIDAKPFRGKRYASDEKDDNVYILDDNDDQLTGYDEIKRLFEEGSVDNKQPSKTTPPMLTTTTTESERERNDIELEELDDETPCSGGGAIFTYTIHNSDDDESQVDSNHRGNENDISVEDYDYYPIFPWFGRNDYYRHSRRSHRKPTRGTWYTAYDSFPFYK